MSGPDACFSRGFLILIGYRDGYVPRIPVFFDELRIQHAPEGPMTQKRVCSICRREFLPRTRYAVACSPGCRREANKQLDRLLCGNSGR